MVSFPNLQKVLFIIIRFFYPWPKIYMFFQPFLLEDAHHVTRRGKKRQDKVDKQLNLVTTNKECLRMYVGMPFPNRCAYGNEAVVCGLWHVVVHACLDAGTPVNLAMTDDHRSFSTEITYVHTRCLCLLSFR